MKLSHYMTIFKCNFSKVTLFTVLVMITSCKKFVDVGSPATKIDGPAVFASDAAAISLVTGIYSKAATASPQAFTSLSLSMGLSADEFKLYGTAAQNALFYTNKLTSQGTFSYYWPEFYKYIFEANETLEGLSISTGVSATVKTRLEGEAKFIRAYFYFYLVNLYGDVPLVTTTDYKTNLSLGRASVANVYSQIIQDLKDAQSLLSTDYLAADLKTVSAVRVRPNKYTATALLAKAYLFTGDYTNAIAESGKVIAQSNTYSLETLDKAFLVASRETIFSFQPTSLTSNTYEGNQFILVTAPTESYPVAVSSYLYNSFEAGDNRKVSWIGSFTTTGTAPVTYRFPYKYKVRATGAASLPLTENEVLMRLAEQYLIRAEAYIQTGQIALGMADLNTLRARSRATPTLAVPNPLPGLSASLSKADALLAVEHERQVELFSEFGDRWLTLKRMKGYSNPTVSRADEVMPAITLAKGGVWNTNWQLYPVPASDILSNINLTQNPGYN